MSHERYKKWRKSLQEQGRKQFTQQQFAEAGSKEPSTAMQKFKEKLKLSKENVASNKYAQDGLSRQEELKQLQGTGPRAHRTVPEINTGAEALAPKSEPGKHAVL